MNRLRIGLVLGASLAASVATVACVSDDNGVPPPSDAGGFDASLPPIDAHVPDSARPDAAPGADTGVDATIEDAGSDVTVADASDAATPVDAADAADASDGATPVDAADASDGATPVDAAVDASDSGAPADAGHDGSGGPPPPPPSTFTSGRGNPEGVVVVNGSVFWVEQGGGQMFTCTAGSMCLSPTLILSNLTTAQSITSDGTSLYWAANTFQPGGAIFSASVAQCLTGPTACQASVQTIGSNLQYPGDVSVDANNVYFTGVNTYEGGTNDALFWCPKTGCPGGGQTPNVFVTGLSEAPSETYVSGTTLYFGQDTIGVQTCTLPGCSNPTPLQGPSGVNGIATDATRFYWSDPGGNAIYACPLAGCGGNPPTVVGQGIAYPNAIAVDSTHIYVSVGSQSDAGASDGIYTFPK